MIVFAASLLLAGGPLFAQDTTNEEAPPHWVPLTDSVGQAIGLHEDQVQGWKERNAKWNKEYEALGKDPEHKPTYITLHKAREFDLIGFLTGGQYDKWSRMNKRSVRVGGTNNPPGTNMPPDR